MKELELHRPGYQRRDEHIVDYHEYAYGPEGIMLRGPMPAVEHTRPSVAFVGAAQTFGCFVEEPFPERVEDLLDVQSINLGYGGAGPRFFLEHRELVDRANEATVAVVQIMSGRSEDNRMYRSGGLEYLQRRADGFRVGANEAYNALVQGYDPEKGRPTRRLERKLRRRLGRVRAPRIVEETKSNWVDSTNILLGAIDRPTVLLWFSTRAPQDLVPSYRSGHSVFGTYPQLVDREMVDAVAPQATTYVEVVSSVGLPQPLIDRTTGAPTSIVPAADRGDLSQIPWTHNRYYPSPEMHELAAQTVATELRTILEGKART